VLRKPRAGGPEQDLHVRDGRSGRRRNGHRAVTAVCWPRCRMWDSSISRATMWNLRSASPRSRASPAASAPAGPRRSASGQARVNWEVEQRRLVDLVAALAPQPAGVSAWGPARA
jgi:hypothetical protein